MTWLHMARRIASEFGLALNDEEADFLLWEETGFPEFFIGDPVATCANQLRSAFRRRGHRRIYPMHAYSVARHAARCPGCGRPPGECGPACPADRGSES